MTAPKSSGSRYLFVDGHKDPAAVISGASDKNTEARSHVQKNRRPRHVPARKSSMLHDCHIQVKVVDRFCNSTLQSPGTHGKSSKHKDQRPKDNISVPRPASMDSLITLPAKNAPMMVHGIIDHAVRVFWPGLTPVRGIKDGAINPVSEAYLQAISSSPLAYHAYILASLGNRLSLIGPQAVTKAHTELILLHRVATLRLINDEIGHLQGPPSDELIGAIMTMAGADPGNTIDHSRPQKSRFQSPLAKAQFLQVFGAQPIVREHVLALTRLIPLKGGWEYFRTFKLAEVCELVDLVSAFSAGSKPVFPPIDPLRSTILRWGHVMDHTAQTFSSRLATSLINFPFYEKRPRMANVVMSMKEVTIALDHFQRGGKCAPDLADIIQARNATQHTLLSLPESPGYTSSEDAYLYRICRQCLLIYSNMVIFPLPPPSGVATRLAVTLKAQIADDKEAYHRVRGDTAPQLILWALVLGGISDRNGTEGSWFLQQYSRLSSGLGILTWGQLENCLTSFLWLDVTLNKEAVGFWTESRTRTAADLSEDLS